MTYQPAPNEFALTYARSGETRRDMDALRELLGAWRDAKKTAWRAVVGWLVRIGLAMLLVGIAVRLRLTDLITG